MCPSTQEMLLEALCQRQRLDLVGEITGAVAHDLNNALSVVHGNVELLLERFQEVEGVNDDQLLQDILTAHNWSMTAMAAAQRLLHFSQQLRATPKPLVANDLVMDATQMCSYRCQSLGLLLLTELAATAGEVYGPPGQILQVLIAMLQNAREALTAAGEGGSIRVRTVVAAGQVRFEVEDDGPGIAANMSEEVFAIGYTSKFGDPAAGLGLTLGRRIARACGGDLIVEAGIGNGLQVLLLPRIDGGQG